MKIKVILIFVLALAGWLIATNYPAISAKLATLNQTPSETPATDREMMASENDADIPEEITPELSSENTQEEIKSIEKEINEEKIEVAEASVEIEKEIPNENETIEFSEENNTQQGSDQVAKTEVSETNTTMTMAPTMPHTWMNPMAYQQSLPMMNSYMMDPNTYMNPYAAMMPMMMNMMGPMMNPAMWMNPTAFINHPVNVMTQSQNMDAMMRTMDPKLMFGMFGQPSQAYLDGETPDQLPVVTIPGFPTQSYENWPKNTVSPRTSREAKLHAFQTAMAMSPLSMRNMVSMMADKIPVEEGVSWDDAVEAMKLRANEVNFKFVGSSPLWKQIEAETEQPSAKVEMFRFCDARMARKILDEVPEFIVFLPCKIALIEDAEGKLWVMTLDWDVSWLDYAQNPNSHLSKDIREHAKLIRDNIQYIMEGAATGDF